MKQLTDHNALHYNIHVPTNVEFIPITLDIGLLKERQKTIEQVLIKTGVPPQLLNKEVLDETSS